MAVNALATDGTEYEVYYKSEFDSFKHFLPTVEYIIGSFRTTGSEPVTDFFLESGNNTNQSDNRPMKPGTQDDDFSLN